MFLCKLFEDNQRTSSGISGVLKNMHRLYVPMYYNDKLYGVQITVKESYSETTIGNEKSNNKIYSLEAVDVENLFDKSQEEWKKEYIRRNEKYLNKKDFEMGGDLPVQKGASSSPNSYELFSKSAVTFFETIINVNKKSDNARFSFAGDRSSEAQRQYDEVVAKYKDTDQWLKAPNGQPTNLTERQWVMVRTPNFKNWFGDWENDPENASKVVDESEVFERFNESSPYWNTRRGQSFLRITHRRLSNSKRSEIDLNLGLVSKYKRKSQDKDLEKVLAQIDIDLLNSNLDKGLLFKEKITRALGLLEIGYTTQNRANASSQYLKLKLPNGNSIDVRASEQGMKFDDIRWKYEETRSQAELDELSTIKVDINESSNGEKFIMFKNFYNQRREPYKNNKTIEDFWKNALSSSDSARRQANISHAQKSQSLGIASSKLSESQGEIQLT